VSATRAWLSMPWAAALLAVLSGAAFYAAFPGRDLWCLALVVGETGEVTVLAPGQQCSVEMAELSAGGCHLEFRFVCVTPSGIVGTYSGFNDANSDGSEIVGELDVQGDFGDGTGCASKYSFEMIRQ
jgi:hypothetical protein